MLDPVRWLVFGLAVSAASAWAQSVDATGPAEPASGPVAAMPSSEAVAMLYRGETMLSASAQIGQRLYLQGLHADGRPLLARRDMSQQTPPLQMQGDRAACVQCHRSSGLGTVEGNVLVPPITGRALFSTAGVAVMMDTRSRQWLSASHAPYNLASLAAALRQGRHISGRRLHVLMPVYDDLSDEEVQGLMDYLQTLSATWSPGVMPQKVRIASVITPDVPSAEREAAKAMLTQLVSRKNLGTRPGRRHMVNTMEFLLRSERQWAHEVWELSGPPDTWGEQLARRQAQSPVFAIVSGLARDWRPVHAFCERERVPCWLPVAELLPEAAAQDHFGVYFDAGLALDAQVMAKVLTQHGPAKGALAQGHQVVQMVADEPAARQGAAWLAARVSAQGAQVQTHVLPSGPSGIDEGHLRKLLAGLGRKDHLALWLRPEALALVGRQTAPAVAEVLLPGHLADAEHLRWPEAWSTQTGLAYPYELPARRQGNLSAFRSWLAQAHQPLVDEAMQSKLYFALNAFNETMGDMLNNMHREYLLERAETMLSRRDREVANAQVIAQRSLRRVALDLREKSQSQARTTAEAATAEPAVTQAELSAARDGTTIYPNLSLGPGQRLASKGAWWLPLASVVGHQAGASVNADWVLP